MRKFLTFGLILLSGLCSAVRVQYLGESYQIKWGTAEQSDLVSPYPVHGNPACFKKGSWFALTLLPEAGDPPIDGWQVHSAKLRRKDNGALIWQGAPTGHMGPLAVYQLPNLPDHVEWAYLDLHATIFLKGDPEEPPVDSFAQSPADDIFIVNDAPTGVMSPAWVGLLRYSCYYARTQNTSVGVADALTRALFNRGRYIFSRSWFTHDPARSENETFWLNGFLAYAGGDELGGNPTLAVPTGQCNDFGDFLTCMMQSHGIAAVAYRSYEMSKVYWGGAYGENSGWNILTNVFKKAGGESLSATFTYHQFAGLGPTVYDGAVGPATLAYQPVVGLPAALYKSILIQEFLYWHNHVRINPHPIPDPWGPVIVTVTPTVHPNPQSLF